MASDLSRFKTRLSIYAESEHKLPAVALNRSTDLGIAMSKITSVDVRNEGETDGQMTARFVDEICAALSADENQNAVEIFNATTESFTNKIKSAYTDIQGIRAVAKDLSVKMDEYTSQAIAADQYVSTHECKLTLTVDFPEFKWDGVNIIGAPSYIIKSVNSLMTAESVEVSEDIDARVLNVITTNIDKYADVKRIEMTDDTHSSITDQASEVCGDIPKGSVIEAVDMTIGIRSFSSILGILRKIVSPDTSALFSNMKEIDSFLTSYYPVIDAIITKQISLPDECAEAIVDNAKKIQLIMLIAAYYELMERRTIFSEAVLLQGGLLNADTVETFQSEGGTKQMIANYIRFMYNDDLMLIPVAGVKGQAIIAGDEAAATAVKKETEIISNRIALAKNTIRITAFRLAAHEYLTKKIDAISSEEDVAKKEILSSSGEEAIKSIGSAIRQFNIHFMDAALSLIVSVEYKGSFVEHLYNQLGAAYLASANAGADLTAEDIRQAEAGVIARLISDFVVDKMMEVIPLSEQSPAVVPAQQAQQ